MTRPNQNGRALEYCLSKALQAFCNAKNIPFSISESSKGSNSRDKAHFERMSKELQADFELFSSKAVGWLEREVALGRAKKITLERFSDSAGFEGDVTDILLSMEYADIEGREIRLSIKNQHNALKHPRVPRIPYHCGIKDEKIVGRYMKKREAIWANFVRTAKRLKKNAKLFRELKSKDRRFIDKQLYVPINKLVMEFLGRYANTPDSIAKFFTFLTSTGVGFYTLKNEKKKIVVKKFMGVKLPRSFKMRKIKPSTFLMEFDNGWILSMRLHTASSRIYTSAGNLNKSTKYDVLCTNIEDVVETEEISKNAP